MFFKYGHRNETEKVELFNNTLFSQSIDYLNGYSIIENEYLTGYNEKVMYNISGRIYRMFSNEQIILENIYSNENTSSVITNNLTSSNAKDALLRKTVDNGAVTLYYYDQTDYNNDQYIVNEQDNPYRQITKIESAHLTKLIGYDKKRRVKKSLL